MSVEPEVESGLLRASLFQGGLHCDAVALAREFDVIEASRQTVLFSQGEPATSLYVVLAGKVKLARRTEDGREIRLALMAPPDEFGELSLLDRGPHTATAIALTDVLLARLPLPVLQEWLNARPRFALALLGLMAHRLRCGHAMLADFTFVDVQGRVANQLLALAGRFGRVDPPVLRVQHDPSQREFAQLVGASRQHDPSQREFAQLVGASRETVNKTLADLAGRGCLRVDRKSVVITDHAQLAHRGR